MGCDGPLTAYRPSVGAADRRLVFDKRKSNSGIAVQVPCGQCAGCKLEHSRQWAVRCMHELKMHAGSNWGSAMLNLTYDNKHLPYGYTLSLADYQNFLKKLRKVRGPGLRFFGCGEYGDKFGRPHYHIITFNYRPTDTKLVQRKETYNYYSSESLSDLWGKGNIIIGDVSFDSCAYVARYCLKKITGKKADDHYSILLPDGTRFNRRPEFTTMSRKPGLAFEYYQTYKSEILAHDNIIMNGHEMAVPRYYDKLTENSDANMRRGNLTDKTILENLKKNRLGRLTRQMRADSKSSRRSFAKQKIRAAKLKQKSRIL